MDPSKPESFNHRTEKLSTGRTYHFVDQKPDNYDPKRTTTILAVHGFPEFWWSWRHQIKPWVTAGYRVIVPDMLGYGGSDHPEDHKEYSAKRLSNDLAALLDLNEIDKAVVIGHDWGSFIVGRFALWHPTRLLGLGHVSIAFTEPMNGPKMSLEQFISLVEQGIPALNIPPYPDVGYQIYFASQDIEDALQNPETYRRFFKILIRRFNTTDPGVTKRGEAEDLLVGSKSTFELDPASNILSDDELDYYISQIPSLHGPLCYYRTFEERFDEDNDPETGLFTGKEDGPKNTVSPDLPVLFIRGLQDPTSGLLAFLRMKDLIPQTKVVEIDAGHWITMEAKEELTEAVLTWVKDDLKL